MLFRECAKVFATLEITSSRLEMTDVLSELFKKTKIDEIQPLVYMIQGILAPPYHGLDLGLGEKFALQAIAKSSGHLKSKVDAFFKKSGDLGETAEYFLSKKKQLSLTSNDLTIEGLFNSLIKISKLSGKGSQDLKIKYLVEILNNSTPLESKFIIRFILGQLRLGVGDPTILDSLSFIKAGDKSLRSEIERAYNVCSDLGLVAKTFFENYKKIKSFKVEPFKPLIPALAERLSNPQEIIDKIGKCAIEYKFDGLRLQCHKQNDRVEIYSRKLEKMTHMFPEIVESIKSLKPKEIIFEGEALAFSKSQNKYLSFQETMHRKRKHGIEKSSKDFPLNVFVFDVLYVDKKDLTQKPFKQRRKTLEKIFPKNTKSNLKQSEKFMVKSAEELDQIFSDSIKENLEGIMAKDLNAPYTAGKRKFAWIKLKKSYGRSIDTIDVVIVGYYLGKGSRAKFGFGGLLCAVYNGDLARLETIAKIGTGFSEDDMKFFKENLEKIKIKDPPKNLEYKLDADVWVDPKLVVEVAFDEITLSPIHTCGISGGKGFALRFPRIIKLRDDKSIKEITTTKEVIDMYWLTKN